MLIALAGCKKPISEKSGSAAPSASAGGPCENYAADLCEKAGKESSTCQAAGVLTSVMAPSACVAGIKDIDFSAKKLAAQKKTCVTLTEKLCAALGPKTDTCKMVREKTPQFPSDRCAAMLQHYDEVLAELKKQESANQPLSPELQAEISKGEAPQFGPKDSKVTVVEFSDFQCPYCARAADVVHQLREKYGTRVHFIFRQFPLPFHEHAHDAAEAALAANAQGKFWDFHDRLFAHQSQLDRSSLEQHAKEAGLDVKAFKKALDGDQFAPNVESDMALGQRVSVQGTPTLFVNGKSVSNPMDFGLVSQMIDDAFKG